MAFDLQPRLDALRAAKLNLARLERELSLLQQQHRDAAACFAQQQGRAVLEGARLDKPPQLLALGEDVARMEAALPNARASRLEELRVFKLAAVAALREHHAAALPAARAKLQQAYDAVASAIAGLAGVIGADAARGILAGGEHVQPIRERLQRDALPEAGLLHHAERIEHVAKRLLDAVPEEVPVVAAANSALFVVPPSGGQELAAPPSTAVPPSGGQKSAAPPSGAVEKPSSGGAGQAESLTALLRTRSGPPTEAQQDARVAALLRALQPSEHSWDKMH